MYFGTVQDCVLIEVNEFTRFLSRGKNIVDQIREKMEVERSNSVVITIGHTQPDRS